MALSDSNLIYAASSDNQDANQVQIKFVFQDISILSTLNCMDAYFFALGRVTRRVEVRAAPRGIKKNQNTRCESLRVKHIDKEMMTRGFVSPPSSFKPNESAHLSPRHSFQLHIHLLLLRENLFHILILLLDGRWKCSSTLVRLLINAANEPNGETAALLVTGVHLYSDK